MRVVNAVGGFNIVKGSYNPQFFSFLVDDDSSCWSKRADNAQTFTEKDEAMKWVTELKRRERLKRDRRNQYK